ncbi:hypothetical protein GGD83_000672 [Rhodoblastus sphagnicola]|uniref:hypothetical protein n=1 Tax=Rhodoblastus sphagnicola TaxID=333368 RepID=UPI001304C66E|nr:hypothetical protein [Rhodoblastus sphagnicola]MBB4196895.1 hypothetical protein [Rhodoblastus sphagnicola]
MTYHNLVKAGFALACAFVLEMTINLGGDLMFSPTKPKVGGYVVAVATPAQK